VDTYLRFAEAVNRLDLAQNGVSRSHEPQVERSEEPPTTEQELKGVDMASLKEVQKIADGLEQLVSELRSEIDNGADFERMTQIADEISEQADNTAQMFSSVNETLMSRINEVTGKSGNGRSSSSGSSSKKTSKESA
jgi:hypothetical protein